MPTSKKKDKPPSPEPCKVFEYSLAGMQVQPDAGYWMFCSKLHIPTIKELTDRTDKVGGADYFPPYPDPCDKEGKKQTEAEIAELVELAGRRDDPCYLVGKSDGALGRREPISKLLSLAPPPLGAVMVNRFPGEQIIRTGRGMARAVESETPGLFHRHALNYLIAMRNWSPPRQALVWAMLDVAIAGALQAAWYYKWIADTNAAVHRRPLTSFRERPIEYARRNGIDLTVLFDHPDELNPTFNRCPDGRDPASFSSGTPRHPAYPSGHSTYTGAASEILRFFFGAQNTPETLQAIQSVGAKPDKDIPHGNKLGDETNYLADNIGLGRLWAGIHWRSDHERGMKLGRTVARLVLEQVAEMNIGLCTNEPTPINQCDMRQKPVCTMNPPPTREQLEKMAKQFKDKCGKPEPLPDECPAPSSKATEQERLDANRGVQQGGQ